MLGWIYCLSNESMPGVFKVGMTNNTPSERALQLYKTSIPTKFIIEFAKEVINPKAIELKIHKKLKNRVNKKREFFKDSLEDILKLFDKYQGNWYKEGNYYTDKGLTSKQILDFQQKNENVCKEKKGYYIVEQILDFKIKKNKLYCNIKWEGYADKECTWEPLENIPNDLIVKYLPRLIIKKIDFLEELIDNNENVDQEIESIYEQGYNEISKTQTILQNKKIISVN